MLIDGTNVECVVVDDVDDEFKRNSVIDPTLAERHETEVAD